MPFTPALSGRGRDPHGGRVRGGERRIWAVGARTKEPDSRKLDPAVHVMEHQLTGRW